MLLLYAAFELTPVFLAIYAMFSIGNKYSGLRRTKDRLLAVLSMIAVTILIFSQISLFFTVIGQGVGAAMMSSIGHNVFDIICVSIIIMSNTRRGVA